MIASPPPRKERGLNVSPRRFGWRWLALLIVGLGLIVLLVIYYGPGNPKAPARVPKLRDRKPGAVRFSELDSSPETGSGIAEPATVEPKTGNKSAAKRTDSNTTSSLPNALIFRNRDTISHGPKTGGANLVSIREIQPSFMKSPVYVLEKGPVRTFTPRTSRVVVSFDLSEPHLGELTFRYEVSMGSETFVGTLTHVDISGAGAHQAAAFIIPPAIEAVIQRGDFDANKSVAIEVVALAGETELARASFGARPVLPGREKSGFLRSVEDTPFAPLEIDLYELAEPQSR